MNDKNMNILNIILYYVLAPILVLEFFLSDMNILKFTWPLFVGSVIVLFVLVVISVLYRKKNPDYDFKENDLYTKILFLIILMECFYSVGFFRE